LSLADNVTEKIKVLYTLGDDGRYEIIKRNIFLFDSMFVAGKSSKEMVDRMMDKGVKPLELGISLAVSLSRCNPKHLSKIDQEVRQTILDGSKDMLEEWGKLEAQND